MCIGFLTIEAPSRVFGRVVRFLGCGQDHLTKNEVIYIATDEKDLSLFDPFKDRARVRFLSDYYERAGVSELNPNLLGMLEQVHRNFLSAGVVVYTLVVVVVVVDGSKEGSEDSRFW